MRRVAMRRAEMVEVVTCHFAQHVRKARFDLGPLAAIKGFQLGDESLVRGRTARLVERAEAPALTLDGAGFDREHVVHHVAVGDRARTARVVARHAAERGLGAGRYVDWKPKALWPQR